MVQVLMRWSPSRRTKKTPALLIAAVFLLATSAGARTFIVDQSGTGDFSTIQAALDSVGARGMNDTIVVHAGHYPEHLAYPNLHPLLLTCSAGPDSTSALSIASFLDDGSWGDAIWVTRGLTFLEPCALLAASPNWGYVRSKCLWQNCAFRSAVAAAANGGPGIFEDCDFYGPVALGGFMTQFRDLRFHHAPLTTSKMTGTLEYRDCLFEGGSADTLVRASFGEDMRFSNCTFESASVGIYASGGIYNSYVDSCLFRGLGVGVLGHEWDGHGQPEILLMGNRFDSCRRAVLWPPGALILRADTLLDCGDQAITAGRGADIDGVVATRTLGCTVDLRVATDLNDSYNYWNGPMTVRRSTFEAGLGPAVRIEEGPAYVGSNAAVIQGNRFERCASATQVSVGVLTANRNVAFANTSSGFTFTLTSRAGLDSVAFNTSVLNGGPGLVVTSNVESLPPGLVVARNIAAMNGGGIAIGSGFAGTFTSNDAWSNQGSQYSGVTPDASNLELDPRFCAPLTGDLTLNLASPCAPNAITGPIGALGVGCSDSLTTPALLSLVSAEALADRVELTWFGNGSPGEAATVYRATTDAEWLRVADIAADGAGYLRYSDVAVVPGTRYGYRLGIGPGGSAPFVGSTWVVAASPALALEGVRPNPSRSGPLTAQFVLGTAGPAQLELLDVTGRRITSHEVGTLGVGRHSLDLARGMTLPPGVYLVRLTTAGRAITARAVVLK